MSEHDKLAEAREALERITDYFDQRADAEAVGDPARYQGNREMYLRRDAETVAAALASARAEGAAEAFERAAKACDNVKAVHRADADRAAENDQPLAWSASDGCSITAENIAAAIRALAEKERGK